MGVEKASLEHLLRGWESSTVFNHRVTNKPCDQVLVEALSGQGVCAWAVVLLHLKIQHPLAVGIWISPNTDDESPGGCGSDMVLSSAGGL